MLNPNDYLAGVNVSIALAFLMLASLFLYRLFCARPHNPTRRVSLICLGLAFIFSMLDYGTTGFLRIIDNVAYPGVPNSLLPDFALYPLGFNLLLLWRTLLSLCLWTFIIYISVRGVTSDD